MKEFKTEFGPLVINDPDVFQVYDFIDTISSAKGQSGVALKKKIIQSLAPIADVSKIEGVSCFDDIVKRPKDFAAALGEAADYIYKDVMDCFAKKN